MPMERNTKITFASYFLAALLFSYGKMAFQELGDRPNTLKFTFGFTNGQPMSPDERLRVAQYACRENLLFRSVPLRADGDAADLRDSCLGDRVLRLERAGGKLNPLQIDVFRAASLCRQQQRYYWLAAFFLFFGSVPWLYNKGKHFVTRLKRAFDYCHNVLKKMS